MKSPGTTKCLHQVYATFTFEYKSSSSSAVPTGVGDHRSPQISVVGVCCQLRR
uniref:Uncharacterized protein n=1 Tax=Arion vulgaris TaxID=1028688 RepID=A0A0B6ZJE9_9EUPU